MWCVAAWLIRWGTRARLSTWPVRPCTGAQGGEVCNHFCRFQGNIRNHCGIVTFTVLSQWRCIKPRSVAVNIGRWTKQTHWGRHWQKHPSKRNPCIEQQNLQTQPNTCAGWDAECTTRIIKCVDGTSPQYRRHIWYLIHTDHNYIDWWDTFSSRLHLTSRNYWKITKCYNATSSNGNIGKS